MSIKGLPEAGTAQATISEADLRAGRAWLPVQVSLVDLEPENVQPSFLGPDGSVWYPNEATRQIGFTGLEAARTALSRGYTHPQL